MLNISTDSMKTLLWKSLPFFCLMVLAAWPRLLNLSVQGMHGDGDNTYYYNVAMQWAQGNSMLDYTCRPVVFFLHGLGIQLFGFTDYAVKYIVATCGILSVGLTYVLGLLVSKRRIVAIGAGLTIALAPKLIEYSRIESPHIIGLFFVLCSAVLLVWWYRLEQINVKPLLGGILLAASGMLLGLTALTHEELAFLGPACVLFIAIVAWLRGSFLKNAFIWSATFTAAFFIPVVATISIFGWEEVRAVTIGFYEIKAAVGAKSLSVFTKLFSYPARLIAFPFNGIFFYLYLMAILFFGYDLYCSIKDNRTDINIAPVLCILLPIIYIILFCAFFSSNPTRVFMPLSPFVAVLIFHAVAEGLSRVAIPKVEMVTTMVVVLGAFSVTAGFYHRVLIPNNTIGPYNETMTYRTTLYRDCRDAILDGMDYRNRLLVVPYTVYNQNHYWELYFGPRLVDKIGDYVSLSFPDILSRGDIRYVAIAKTMLGRDSGSGVPKGQAYGIPEAEYTEAGEVSLVRSHMQSIGATKVHDTHTVEIWELRDKKSGGDVYEKYGLLVN